MIQSHGTTRFPSDAFIKSATAQEQAHHNENETPSLPMVAQVFYFTGWRRGQQPGGEERSTAWKVASLEPNTSK